MPIDINELRRAVSSSAAPAAPAEKSISLPRPTFRSTLIALALIQAAIIAIFGFEELKFNLPENNKSLELLSIVTIAISCGPALSWFLLAALAQSILSSLFGFGIPKVFGDFLFPLLLAYSFCLAILKFPPIFSRIYLIALSAWLSLIIINPL